MKDLWSNPDTAETSCAGLVAALEQLKKSSGNYFEIVGSVVDPWSDSATTVTFVKASGDMTERIFRIHWLDRKYWGLGGQAIASPAAMILRAASDGSCFGWQLAIDNGVIVKFGKDASSNKTFLDIRDGNQTLRAYRERD